MEAMELEGPETALCTSTDTINGLKNTENFRPGAARHVLMGEVNSKGRATGYHYEGLSGAPGSIIPGTKSTVDSHGVYTAKVQVNGITKNAKSSFFPTSMTPQDIIDATNQAYANKVLLRNNEYAGYATNGMEIHMYLDTNGKIISFFSAWRVE